MNPAGAILDPKPASSDQLLEFFAPHADREGAVLLESTLTAHGRGQRSFAAANPVDRWRIDTHQPLPADWQTQLNRFTADRSKFYTLFLSYEFGREALTGQTTTAPADDPFPKLVCYRYDNVLEITHHSPAVTNSHTPEHNTAPRAQLISRPDPQRYLADINIIKSHIFEGDIYQANYTGQWRLQSDDPPWTVYQRLRQLNPGQYAGFANLGSHTVLSSSPERLFCVEGDTITANPIKGTIARGATEQESAHNRNSLLNSAKDRAELLMIVDLLRNDLGRVCQPGGVTTPHIWRAEDFNSLIHLVGEIVGRLRADMSLSELINAIFPGGSITGAPKRRAMEILSAIEGRRRGIYTGSFGYLHHDSIDMNIAIRTISARNGVYTIQAGGGIVADSDPQAEFDEARLKARNLIKALDPTLEP